MEGKQLTLIFFAASRAEFAAMMHDDPKGRTVGVALCDDKRQPASDAAEMRVLTRLPEGSTAGTYGCSGVRWLIEPQELPDDYREGRIIRVFQAGQ